MNKQQFNESEYWAELLMFSEYQTPSPIQTNAIMLAKLYFVNLTSISF